MSPRAPKKCGKTGCDQRVVGRSYCATHAAWQTSTGHHRTSTRDWRRRRARILTRDNGVCHVCQQPGADTVDHIRPVAEGGSDDDHNLAAIHDTPCHRRKTSSEGHRARGHRA